ncbi:MAG: hypothetical protein DRI23_11155, partial [Candidatus Cloacimonadota bacterium]
MKSLIYLIITVFFFKNLTAIHHSRNEALNIAEHFVSQRDENYNVVEIQYSSKHFYVFQLSPKGFIIISSDTDLPPIVAYSFKDNFQKEDMAENPLQKIIELDLNYRKSYADDHADYALANQQEWFDLVYNSPREFRNFQQWPSDGSTSTDGWIETEWHQNGSYKQKCPLDNNGQRCPAGLNATDISMIMNFHKYIGDPVFTDADDYITAAGMLIDDDHLSRDFPSFPELNNYLQQIVESYQAGIDLTEDEIAALIFSAGVALQNEYSASWTSSQTWMAPEVLLNKFGYDSADYQMNENPLFYFSLIGNMKTMKPALLVLTDDNYDQLSVAICDGYNTDDYYHLNFGNGSSNYSCWYLLPENMPFGYSVVLCGTLNIEGGTVPELVTGNVNISGISPFDSYIILDGEYFFECWVEEENGDFSFPGVLPGTYTATCILNNRAYYQSFEIQIDENNTFIQFELDEYDLFTGNVSAPISAEGAHVMLCQNDEIKYSGTCIENGDYAIADVLPGEYYAIASLEGNFFEEKIVTVTFEDQTEDFNLVEYPGNIEINYAGPVFETWNLIPNYPVSCAIRLTPLELAEFENDLLSGVIFKSPINQDEGSIKAQIWEDDQLLNETEVIDFSAGDWLNINFDMFFPINPESTYFIGYEITSSSGIITFHDTGDGNIGNGAFFNNGNWCDMSPNNDFNF